MWQLKRLPLLEGNMNLANVMLESTCDVLCLPILDILQEVDIISRQILTEENVKLS